MNRQIYKEEERNNEALQKTIHKMLTNILKFKTYLLYLKSSVVVKYS